MSVYDMDAWAVKTVLLLNSKADDSTEQLRQMLEESIKQKYGNRKQFRPIPSSIITKRIVDEKSGKKMKIESKNKINEPEVSSILESDSSASIDSDDLTMEILENDLTCAVCREIGVVAKNRLVECAECHALYHQECHSPSVSDMDVSDPRLVWYCSNCSKAVAKPKSSITGSSNNGKHYSKINPQKANHVSSSSSYSSKPFGGLPVPAKKINNGSHSKSSSSASNKSVSPNINIISADKRLQIMKKKAAKKQEKRILPK